MRGRSMSAPFTESTFFDSIRASGSSKGSRDSFGDFTTALRRTIVRGIFYFFVRHDVKTKMNNPKGRPPKPCAEINTRNYGRKGEQYVEIARRTDCEGRRLNPHPPYRCKRSDTGRCEAAERGASPIVQNRVPCREVRSNPNIESRTDRTRDLRIRCKARVGMNGKPCVVSKKLRCKEAR